MKKIISLILLTSLLASMLSACGIPEAFSIDAPAKSETVSIVTDRSSCIGYQYKLNNNNTPENADDDTADVRFVLGITRDLAEKCAAGELGLDLTLHLVSGSNMQTKTLSAEVTTLYRALSGTTAGGQSVSYTAGTSPYEAYDYFAVVILKGIPASYYDAKDGLLSLKEGSVDLNGYYKTTAEGEKKSFFSSRNNLTSVSIYSGRTDTSWYNDGSSVKEYTLTSADQFMGFLQLRSQNTTFEGITVRLGTDVVINRKTVEQMLASPSSLNKLTEMSSDYHFKGAFDGQGHSISGAYMTPGASFRSIFGTLGDNGTIKNLTLKNSLFVNRKTGATSAFITGRIKGTGTLVENVHVEGCIIRSKDDSLDHHTVSALVGRVDSGSDIRIKDCSVDASTLIDISASASETAGGIVSLVQTDATVTLENTTCAATVAAKDVAGGLVANSTGTVKIDAASSFNGTLVCTTGSKKDAYVADGNMPLFISVYSGTPDISWYRANSGTNEYTLSTADQFMGFLQLRSENTSFDGITLKLATNVEINGATAAEMATTAPAHSVFNLNSGYHFTGIFDGQGYIISGAYMDMTAGMRGLFGGLGTGAQIKNLTVDNACFLTPAAAKGNVGIVAARANGTNVLIENVHVTNSLVQTRSHTFTGAAAILGRVDTDMSATLRGCTVDAATRITLSSSGSTGASGLVSSVLAGATLTLENSVCAATLSAPDLVGGLVFSNLGTVNIDWRSHFTGTMTCTAGSTKNRAVASGTAPVIPDSYCTNSLLTELRSNQWTVYYGDRTNRISAAATATAVRLSSALGRQVSTVVGTPASGHTIRLTVDGSLGLYDYRITYQNGSYQILGGSAIALENAANAFFDHLVSGDLLGGSYTYTFDTSLFSPIVSDPSSFIPVWKDSITVPDWMLDFEEKIAALFDAGGRPLLLSHGRAGYLYRQNTVEDTLSNILLGADILEMDVYHTKDGVIVMSHDATLPSNVVNFREISSKEGYPKSNKIADWTYAQLQELDIVMTSKDGSLTGTYKMATLYEVLLLTRGRCFVMIDKKDSWVTTADILEIAQKTDSMECFLYSMFLGSDSGYTGTDMATQFYPTYLAQHPENTYQKHWYDLYTSYASAASYSYPARKWALKDGTSGTGKTYETTTDYERVVRENGSHVIMWTNEMTKATLFISQNYQATVK